MTETELCAEFMAWARGEGHRCYPEWAGFDILVTAEGIQIGIEAKLRANVKVLAQALEPQEHRAGPEFHAVLVPKASQDFKIVARQLRIYTIDWSVMPAWRQLPHITSTAALRWDHSHPVEPPPVEELAAAAGSPSPVRLTPWKITAMKLWLRLESKGYLTSKDFRALGINMSTWVGRWIQWDGSKVGRLNRYVAKEPHPHDPRPDQLHPEVTEALRVEVVDSGATTE